MKVFVAILCLAYGGLWIYQLVSGKLVSHGLKAYTTREKASMHYWASLALQAIILLAGLWFVVNAYLEEKR